MLFENHAKFWKKHNAHVSKVFDQIFWVDWIQDSFSNLDFKQILGGISNERIDNALCLDVWSEVKPVCRFCSNWNMWSARIFLANAPDVSCMSKIAPF